MEKFTPLAKFLHCGRQWRQWQISPLYHSTIYTAFLGYISSHWTKSCFPLCFCIHNHTSACLCNVPLSGCVWQLQHRCSNIYCISVCIHSCIHAMFLPLLVCDTCGKLPSRRDTSAGRDANLANFNVSARTYKSSHKDLKYQKWYFASLYLSNFPNSQCMF